MAKDTQAIEQLFEVFNLGLQAFDGDKAKFLEWLKCEIPALNGQKPLELLLAPKGIEMVKDELIKIEYSNFC